MVWRWFHGSGIEEGTVGCRARPVALAGAQAQQGSGTPPEGATAQDGPRHGPPTPAQELARLTRALGLTSAQQTAILPILQKRQEQMEALRKNETSREEGREQMRTVMETAKAGIRAQLTESQQGTFDAMRPPHRPGDGQGPGGPGENGGSPPPSDR